MLRSAGYDIVFREVPDETTLAVNIAACPFRCPGCHSPYLQEDAGEPLDEAAVEAMVKKYGGGITCFAFMGGDADPAEVGRLARFVKARWPTLKVAWYSGRETFDDAEVLAAIDYLKLGPYRRELGGLDSPATNQRFWRLLKDGTREDLTPRFWRNARVGGTRGVFRED
ncbi:MAG: anaerobic ribonucleoside-triphosphate reductase activating protein [Kiritimatiellae bacterium]|nr:anaerobic ribonucleoside-triphosphate reductase activating protein [Kiritimatiellia bacterium]